MAHIPQDSTTNDTSSLASSTSLPQDDIKECNNIRPPQKAFSSEDYTEGPDYLDGYPLERLDDTDTIFLGFQMRQVNWLLDTTKYEIPEEEQVCSYCGAKGKLHRNDTERVQLTTYPYADLPTKITVIRQCYKCQEYGNLCVDAIPGRFEHTNMTQKLADAIFRTLGYGFKGSAYEIALLNRINEEQAALLVNRYEAEHGPRGSARGRRRIGKKQPNN
ncbi:MAG TPA: hypothetical protein H9850_00695 [Candidatus Anaerobiospirillum pullistercoris]|uniref:Uncharacterized protein n=1 Tax=Candidatus Anaerobiospirillum pullistercoris TaxID=2838452 RepID=A0A9D2AZU1_9GAMM|nr:hypothetical protein [Candidatus Anaerobiospirillum pullistercoris]